MNIFKKFRKSIIALVAILCTVLFAASDCEEDPSSQDKESKTQQSSYDYLSENQPAEKMDYSPTRDTIIQWTKVWNQPGKVSYLYLVSNGKPYAFAVMKGLPVSMCVGLTPPYKLIKPEITGDNTVVIKVEAPSVDGAFYGGCQADRFYAFDATTGGYFDFTAGADTTMIVRDGPYPLNLYADALPLGDTTADQAAPANDKLPEVELPPAMATTP